MCTFQYMSPYYDDHCLISSPVPLPSPDSTLILTNVTRVLESVWDMENLGAVLNVPLRVQGKIGRDYATPEQRKNAMVEYWLQSVPNASWSVLAGRFYLLEKTAALEAVKQYIQSPTGMLP